MYLIRSSAAFRQTATYARQAVHFCARVQRISICFVPLYIEAIRLKLLLCYTEQRICYKTIYITKKWCLFLPACTAMRDGQRRGAQEGGIPFG